MALAGIIQQQAPQPNPMGQALVQGAQNIGNAAFQAAQIKQQKNEKLVTMALQFLPKLANDPTMLQQFTSHPDFAQILGAFNQVGLGSVFKYDPGSGAYNVSIPADIPSMEEEYTKMLNKRYTPGSPEWQKGVLDYKSATSDPYTRAIKTQLADAAITTPEEQAAADARKVTADTAARGQRKDYNTAFGKAMGVASPEGLKASAAYSSKLPQFQPKREGWFGEKQVPTARSSKRTKAKTSYQTHLAQRTAQHLAYGK